MTSIMAELEAKMHSFAEELYKNAQAQQEQAPGPPPPNPQGAAGPGEAKSEGGTSEEGDVIDADFRMVDDDKA